MERMKAVRIHKFGGAEELRYEDAPKPTLGPNDVLVKVVAAGVNPFDYKVRRGDYPSLIKSFPAILGWDMAGIVVETGSNVRKFKQNDQVRT